MMKKAFTLIELLVVIAIIAILAGFITSATQTARKRAAKAKAESTIATLEASIGMFESDMGIFPESGNEKLVEALSDEEFYKDDSYWTGPYMRFKQKDLKDGEFIDPWGNPYVYTKGGTQNGSSFYDLYSLGPDGEESGDDVTNW